MNTRIFVPLAAAAALCACQTSKVKISGRFAGTEASEVYLEQVSPLEQGIVDSARLDQEGVYRFELGGVAKTPALYNIVCNGERIPSSSPPVTA